MIHGRERQTAYNTNNVYGVDLCVGESSSFTDFRDSRMINTDAHATMEPSQAPLPIAVEAVDQPRDGAADAESTSDSRKRKRQNNDDRSRANGAGHNKSNKKRDLGRGEYL